MTEKHHCGNKAREELRQEFLTSSQTYCAYCGEEQTRIGCCEENHFETFADMDKRTQEDFLDGLDGEGL